MIVKDNFIDEALNKFVNLLKPGSTLAEEGTKDFGFDFDKTIKSEWRGEFQEAAKTEVNASREKFRQFM